MFLPPEYAWLEPVLIAAVIVFLVDLIGNMISFNNRIINALVTALVFAVIFGVLSYYGYSTVDVSVTTEPSVISPSSPAAPAN